MVLYLDPPFCTGNCFSAQGETAYSDNISKDDFTAKMKELLILCRELLSDEGSLYLHTDYRLSARMRLICDEIFGEENLRNEIIWSYKSGGTSKRHFPRKHDTILFYSKTDNYYFNIEATGTRRGAQKRNNMKRNTDDDGRIFYSIKSNGKEYRYYEDDLIYPTDVWTDIEHLHQRDSERTGYPTQKPLSLLYRIISASSYEGGIICDLFSGSGTTAVAAQNMGRRFIAADNSPLALSAFKKRIQEGECETVIECVEDKK